MTGGDVWSARMRMVDAVLAPFKAVTLGQVFDRVVEEFPHHPAFIFEDRQCSYLEFPRLVAQAERGLWRLRCAPGRARRPCHAEFIGVDGRLRRRRADRRSGHTG
jgi:hypothetical protein